MFEKFQRYFGEKPQEESPEKTPQELRIEALRGRIKDLTEERTKIFENQRHAPNNWGADPRIKQINQEIENLNREIKGEPPLIFHGSDR